MADLAHAALSCPNKPVGSTTITTNTFSSFTEGGWTNYSPSLHSLVTNQAGAPSSPPNALQAYYPTGHEGGYGTGMTYFHPATAYDDLYVCWAFKLDSPFQNHPGGTKVFYIVTANGNTNPFYVHLFNEFPNYNASLVHQATGDIDNRHIASCTWPGTCNLYGSSSPVAPGTWYTGEVYVRQSTNSTSQDGIAKLWIDGAQVVNITNLNTTTAEDFAGVKINPVYGGYTGIYKTQDDYMWFDEITIAAGGGVPSPPPPPPPTPPPVPPPPPPPPPPGLCNCGS